MNFPTREFVADPRCPKCGRGKMVYGPTPYWCNGVKVPEGYVRPPDSVYEARPRFCCHGDAAGAEHLYWACACQFSWVTPCAS